MEVFLPVLRRLIRVPVYPPCGLCGVPVDLDLAQMEGEKGDEVSSEPILSLAFSNRFTLKCSRAVSVEGRGSQEIRRVLRGLIAQILG